MNIQKTEQVDKGDPDSVWRLFIALPLDESLKAAFRERVCPPRGASGGGISWVRPEAMHLTLVFIGDTFAGRVPILTRVLDHAVTGLHPFDLNFGGIGFFGRPRVPRIIWADVVSPPEELFTLQANVVEALHAENVLFDERPFSPHVTLGRVRSFHKARPWIETLSEMSENPPAFGVRTVDRVELIRSILSPEGPRYQTLHVARMAKDAEETQALSPESGS